MAKLSCFGCGGFACPQDRCIGVVVSVCTICSVVCAEECQHRDLSSLIKSTFQDSQTIKVESSGCLGYCTVGARIDIVCQGKVQRYGHNSYAKEKYEEVQALSDDPLGTIERVVFANSIKNKI